MEINKDNITDVLKNEEFISELLPLITESDAVKTIVTNKADLIYKDKITEEVSNLHSMYDNDMFEVLGERPGQIENGGRQKTYVKAKELFTELSDLRKQKDSLTKDAEVIRLTAEIDKLKTEGGAKHVQDVFDQAKSAWELKEADYKQQLLDASNDNISFKKKTEIQTGIQQIKFNPDTPESIKKLVLEQAQNQLIKNSKFEGDKFVVLDANGKPSLNTKFEPKSAFEALMSLDAIKDISLKADKTPGGGGADSTIVGSIQTTSVDGNDTKKLIIPEGSFKTKKGFQEVANKALMDSGISKGSKDYTALIDQAYKDNNVSTLPIQ